jgi:hypothetical protein
MLTELTPQHYQRMEEIRDKWIGIAHSGKYDAEKVEAGMKWVYSMFQQEAPKIVHCDSPLSARMCIHILRSNASVWDSVGASVGASVRASVEASVGAINADNYCNYTDFGWTAWIDFFCEENFTKDNPIWVKFNIWKHFLGAGVFETYSFQNICFVVKSPTKIIKNENGALHNPTGPAIEFPDGYCQYYINGRNLPAWIWEQRDAITKERFLQEKNAEIRGGMYAVLGQKKVFDLIGASEISRKFANNETYVLYRTNEKIGDKYWQWVGVKCPSTATEYLLGVPDTVTCPIEAVAATWGISANEYIINQHT